MPLDISAVNQVILGIRGARAVFIPEDANNPYLISFDPGTQRWELQGSITNYGEDVHLGPLELVIYGVASPQIEQALPYLMPPSRAGVPSGPALAMLDAARTALLAQNYESAWANAANALDELARLRERRR